MATPHRDGSPDHEQRLNEIIAAYLEAVDAGPRPDRKAWLARYPEFADDLRNLFAAQDQFAPLRPHRDDSACRIRYVGDYELLEELGRGGMGVVHKARQVSLNRTVAVKLILDSRLVSETDIHRFRMEAEAAANLQHPCIVPVYEVGVHDGQHYFSMAYIEGRTLATLVREGPLSAAQATRYVRQIAAAIHYAHQQGTLHRDIKPSNVLIDRDDQPHITDFGLAKRVAVDSDLTATGAVIGTPGYMSPEQALSQQGELGPPTDVYALGATLYAALVGRPPFQAANVVDTLQQVIFTPPVSPRVLNPAVPRDLETICLKCLEKDRGKRYATAAELGDDLQRWLNGEPIRARPVGPAGRLWRWVKRQPVIAGLAATAALLLIAGILVSTYFALEEQKRAREADANAVRAEANSKQAAANAVRAEISAKEALAAANRETIRARVANAARLAAQSGQLRNDYPQRSLLLALESLKATMSYGESPTPAAEQSLRDALRMARGRTLPSSGKAITISRDGHWLVTASKDSMARLWDMTANDPTAAAVVLGGQNKPIDKGTISPDSRWLATASTDGTEWLWDLTAKDPASKARMLCKHEDGVWAMSISPDSHWLVSVTWRGTARLWDLTLKDPASKTIVLRGHENGGVLRAMFSSDSHWLVTFVAERAEARLWNLMVKDIPAISLGGHKGGIRSLTISRDSHWLVTAGGDNTARLWDLTAKTPATSAVVLRYHGTGKWIAFAAISPDSRWLVTVGIDRTTRLWDLTAKDPSASVAVLRGVETSSDFGHIDCLDELAVPAISPDGRWLVTTHGKEPARLWDLRAKDPTAAMVVLYGHEAPIDHRVISPNSRWLVTMSSDGTAQRYDLSAKTPATTAFVLSRHERPMSAKVETPDVGDLDDRSVRIRVSYPDTDFGSGFSLEGHYTAISPDSRWLVTCGMGETSARLWDLTAKNPAEKIVTLRGHEEAMRATFSPDSRWLVTRGMGETSARLWDLTAKNPAEKTATLRGHEEAMRATFSPSGRWLVTSDLATTQLWDIDNLQQSPASVALRGVVGSVRSLVTPNSRWLVIASEDTETVLVWDLTAKEPAAKCVVLRGHGRPINCDLAVSPDSRWLVTGNREARAAWLWDLTSKEISGGAVASGERSGDNAKPGVLDLGPGNRWLNARFSPDSRWLVVTGGDDTARLWNLTLKNPAENTIMLRGHRQPISHGCEISSDSRWLVTADGAKTARLWDLTARDPTAKPVVLPAERLPVQFSPDSHWLATAGIDKTVRLWDLTTKSVTAKTIVLPDEYPVAFSPDSHWLITSAADDTFPSRTNRLWDLTGKDPRATSCVFRWPDMFDRFSADGRWLVTSDLETGTTRLWDLTSQDPGVTAIPLLGIVSDRESFGNWLVTAVPRKVRMRWDLTAKNPAATGITILHEDEARYLLTTSPDGHWLVTIDRHGIAHLWNMRLDELIDIARRTAGRELTDEERKQYLLEPGQ